MKIKMLCLIGSLLSNMLFSQAPEWAWAKNAVGGGVNGGMAVETDIVGNVFVTGDFGGIMDPGVMPLTSMGGTDFFVIKYDPSGNIIWAQSGGGSMDDFTTDIAVDSLGNVIVTGVFQSSSMTLGSSVLTNSSPTWDMDFFVVKYDPSGSILWVINGTGTADDYTRGVSIDKGNNIVLTGRFSSPSITVGSATLTNSDVSNDVFIVKLDPMGNVIWAKREGVPGSDEAVSIAIDSENNIAITGSYWKPFTVFGTDTIFNASDTVPGPDGAVEGDVFVVKYDSLGNTIWVRSFGGTRTDVPNKICYDQDGNLLVAVDFKSPVVVIGPDTLYNPGTMNYSQVLLAKYDPAGNLLWGKATTGHQSRALSVDTDTAGSAYLTGYFNGADLNFGTETIGNTGTTNTTEVFTVKYNYVGNLLWVKRTGSGGYEFANDIVMDEEENVYICGAFSSSSLPFGATSLIHTSGNYFIAKLDQNSEPVWPGDANSDNVVDNTDLLALGLWYSQAGLVRTVTGNVWQADTSSNWCMIQSNGEDVKHADCDGNGVINSSDTMAVNLNFSLTHAIVPSDLVARSTDPELYFSSASAAYVPGAWVDVDIMAGTSALPVNDLYGLAFNIQYNASLVESGTESLIFPNSWFASPGLDAIKIGMIDPVISAAYAGETRTDHNAVDGFGKVATFRFQTKSSIVSSSPLNLSFSRIEANDAGGNALFFSPQPYSILVDPTTNIGETINEFEYSIFPNPTEGDFSLALSGPSLSDYQLTITNMLGQQIHGETLSNIQNGSPKSLSLKQYGKGVYRITVKYNKSEIAQKIIVY